MNSILKKDFRRLMLDAGKVQECVEALEQEENSVRAGGRAQGDLTQLASRIVHLEFDLRAILLDCVVLGRHYWKRHNLPLILSLHSALGVTHDLISHLSRIEPSLDKAILEPSALRDLLNHWIQLKGSFRDLQISLKRPQLRRKMI